MEVSHDHLSSREGPEAVIAYRSRRACCRSCIQSQSGRCGYDRRESSGIRQARPRRGPSPEDHPASIRSSRAAVQRLWNTRSRLYAEDPASRRKGTRPGHCTRPGSRIAVTSPNAKRSLRMTVTLWRIATWCRKNSSPLMCVPSVIVPEELNVLINPTHPAAADITSGKVRKWVYDLHIWAKL